MWVPYVIFEILWLYNVGEFQRYGLLDIGDVGDDVSDIPVLGYVNLYEILLRVDLKVGVSICVLAEDHKSELFIALSYDPPIRKLEDVLQITFRNQSICTCAVLKSSEMILELPPPLFVGILKRFNQISETWFTSSDTIKILVDGV